jgi:class 3 adenylate cyclase/tetratricopeptide (TPR) repeat protein
MQRERKVVTVLFADLVGFTSRAESLDPEDVHAILRPYHERLRSELERHGGTVEKFIGDAVMALFGAPAAHEDDPERAVRAALAIRDWAQEEGELEVRIGITTGEALVTLGARPEAGEGMASGDIVNTAARLQAAAAANGILADATTYRATERATEYAAADSVEAKGKSEPVAVWQPVQARSRLEVDVRRPRTALVGRVREVDVLRDALARVRDERSPQLVTLVGEPGIGKSRLVYELFSSLEAEPDLVSWRQGRSLPYGEGVSFWSLGEMVKAQAGILETDSPEAVEEKLRAAVASMESPEQLVRHVGPLAGVGGEVELGPEREEAFGAWRRFFEELADERPLVLVFEDLHWADDGVRDFVDHLLDWATRVPILVVATARPELLERRPDWGGGKRNAATVSLSPLSEEDTAAMVASLDTSLPAEARVTVLQRAGGNPLYAEEFARMLAERGSAEDLPENIQGVIAARLDGLPPEEKALLQRAAVLGKVFWLGAVEAMNGASERELEERLHALERKEFVRRERRSSVEGDTEFAFLHVLVRDVAYGQIPRADRAEGHRRAAEWISALGRPEDHAEMLAHHFLRALELSKAAGMDTEALITPARRALSDAGDRAAGLYALEAAERLYDAALPLYEDGSPERGRLLLRRAAPVLLNIGGGDLERLAQAADALIAAGDSARAAEAEMLISMTFWFQGRLPLADEHSERAVELLEGAPPSRSTAWVRTRRASRELIIGEEERGLELALQSRSEAAEVGSDEGISDAQSLIGLARIHQGHHGEGLADIEQAIELAVKAGSIRAVSRAYNSLSVALLMSGDIEGAYEARREAERSDRRLGSKFQQTWYESILSDFQYRRGNWSEALEHAERAIGPFEAGSPHYNAAQPYLMRALIRLAREEVTGAIEDAEQALEFVGEAGDLQQLSFALPSSAYIFALVSETGRARELLHAFLEPFQKGRTMGFAATTLPVATIAAFHVGLEAELLSALDPHPETLWSNVVRAGIAGDFAEAAELLQRAGAKTDEAEARLHAGTGDQLEQALEFYRSVSATRFIGEGEALLAAAP